MTGSLSLYATIFIVQFFAFFIKGIASFGDGLIATPLLSLRLPNSAISPLHLWLSLFSNASLSYRNRQAFVPRLALPMAAGMLCGVIPGTLLLKYGTPWVLKLMLGVLVLLCAAEMLLRQNARVRRPHLAAMLAVSVFSGFTSGLFGIGAFIVAYVDRTTEGRSAFRGNLTFIFLAENIFRVFAYLFAGLFTPQVLLGTAISLPAMALGLWAGGRADKRMSDKAIRRVVLVVMALGGISAIVNALVQRLG